jgi:hypothetical protein
MIEKPQDYPHLNESDKK